jgi:hypothetical protein
MNNVQALFRKVKQGFKTNEERLSIINLREGVSLGLGYDLLSYPVFMPKPSTNRMHDPG